MTQLAAWQVDSKRLRRQLQMTADAAFWSSVRGAKLKGVAKTDRTRDLIEITAATVAAAKGTKCITSHTLQEALKNTVLDVSQSHARQSYTNPSTGTHPCLTTSSAWYSYRLDRMIGPHENYLLQGHCRRSMMDGCPVLTGSEFKELAGEGFFLGSLATVLAPVLAIMDFRGLRGV